jgi:DNA primase
VSAVGPNFDSAPEILRVIGDVVDLRPVGRRWLGLCPFHREDTPSFSVNAETGFFYCFGCHAKGDVQEFQKRWSGS